MNRRSRSALTALTSLAAMFALAGPASADSVRIDIPGTPTETFILVGGDFSTAGGGGEFGVCVGGKYYGGSGGYTPPFGGTGAPFGDGVPSSFALACKNSCSEIAPWSRRVASLAISSAALG